MFEFIKTILFTILIVFSFCYNQNITEEITSRYDNGNKKEVIKILKSNAYYMELEKITYSEQGFPVIVESFQDNSKIKREYHNNGKLKKEISYKGKFLDGEVSEYYDNGQLKCSFIYNKGIIKPGKYNSYYINGFIKDTFEFGDVIDYYDNGEVKFIAHAIDTITYSGSIRYSDFLKTFIDTVNLGIKYKGDYKRYFENGKLELFIENLNWNNNKTLNIDNVRILNSNGRLIYNFKINHNLYDGKYLSYYDNGNIKIEGTYSSGKKTGRWIEYDESKNIILEENWIDGKKHE